MENYYVQVAQPFGDENAVWWCSEPESAIIKWFELGDRRSGNPGCVGIFARTQTEAENLIKCASTLDIASLCYEYASSYKPEFLIDSINKGLNNDRLISREYDSVFPFSLG